MVNYSGKILTLLLISKPISPPIFFISVVISVSLLTCLMAWNNSTIFNLSACISHLTKLLKRLYKTWNGVHLSDVSLLTTIDWGLNDEAVWWRLKLSVKQWEWYLWGWGLASSARLSVTRSVTPSACFVLHIKTTVLTHFIYCTVVFHPRNLRFCLLMSLEVQGFLTEIKTTCFSKKTEFSASLVTSCSIFNLTWSFRNHSNMLICCFKKIYYYSCALLNIFVVTVILFSPGIIDKWKVAEKQHLLDFVCVCVCVCVWLAHTFTWRNLVVTDNPSLEDRKAWAGV